MYLQRKIDAYLEDWKKEKNHKPLIVKGARQIGKTESILHFAYNHYDQVIVINFIEEPAYKKIIENSYNPDDIIKNITRMDPSKIFIPGHTLIFFDEIQVHPDIATSLKFFHQDGRYDIICSESLLGIQFHSITSQSVGYKTDYVMHSLDFEEFLWAKGYRDEWIQEMLEHVVRVIPFSNAEMQIYHELFIDYCTLGGMPEVVKDYIETKTFTKAIAKQNQLALDYEDDIRKYAVGIDQSRILNIYNHIAPQLAKENKKFQITKVASNARFKDYRGCIEWLADSGIVSICYGLNFPSLPLKGNYDSNKFKLYFADTGILISMLDEEAQKDFRMNQNFGVYKGALYENIVAEALTKNCLPLYYYKKENSTLEEDFFVRSQKSLIPIEVKATKGTSKSLRTLIDSKHYEDIQIGIKLSMSNIGFQANILSLPYFCSFLIKAYLKQCPY